MKDITLENIYKKVVKIEREVAQIKKSLIENSITVKDFSKRYGLK
jgi:hypothetical protein